MQGDLQSRSNKSLNDQFIGDLHYLKNGTPVLIVGHHILHGKETSLGKPMIVLEKKRSQNSDNRDDNNDLKKIESSTSYIVKAIIHKKLLFKARPKPIIANVSKMT